MTSRYTKGKAIDAVLRRIEARNQVARLDDGRSPDDLNDLDQSRRVDYICAVGTTLYALEHTGIEPFADQIALDVHNRELFKPIKTRFSHRTDREFWELHVPVGASADLHGGEIARIQTALIAWIEANAARFPITLLYDKYANPHLAETVTGVPFPVSLHRGSLDSPHFPAESPLCGQFVIKCSVDRDLEPARAERLRKACGDKLGKLGAWKREGAKTVLVLEDNDLSLTNHRRVANALASVMAEISDMADNVFLVSTAITHTWWVICPWSDGKTYDDDPERVQAIDPTGLTRLTRR